jgi:hypothetical protein
LAENWIDGSHDFQAYSVNLSDNLLYKGVADTSSDPDPFIGSFPLAGLTIHYQFSKLYLGHHIFRGLQSDPIPPHFLSVATVARDAAIAIFTMVVENENFKQHIVGMPAYFHIMISFAGQFLLEVCVKYRDQLSANVDQDFRIVSAALAVFARLPVLPQHSIARVTSGLMRKLNECTASLGMDGLLTESPFANLDVPMMTNGNGHTQSDQSMISAFDVEMGNGSLLDDLLYADFNDLGLPDPNFGFIS